MWYLVVSIPDLCALTYFHSAGKVMASIFWESLGVIMIDYIEHGRTINGAY